MGHVLQMPLKWPPIDGTGHRCSMEKLQSELKSNTTLHSFEYVQRLPSTENTVTMSSAPRIEGLVLTKQEGRSLIRH